VVRLVAAGVLCEWTKSGPERRLEFWMGSRPATGISVPTLLVVVIALGEVAAQAPGDGQHDVR